MTALLILAIALLAAMVASECALHGTKLQTGLSRVLVVWAIVYLPLVYLLYRDGAVGLVISTVFWGGAFLSWFGVRSHLESSILLRMLVLLRRRPMTKSALIGEYTALYGEAMRREELLRGGLVTMEGDRLIVSPKGKAILGIVTKLR
ncbi:MAG: hypothetical protein JWN04_4592 [Myxococcaceae bacterium]|nr:hypothetical protein [Myxococcaceae bacterium]